MSGYEKYCEILKEYRAGKFINFAGRLGKGGHLYVDEILEAAGAKDLFDKMTDEELEECIEKSQGNQRMMFCYAKKARKKKTQ